MGKRSISIRWDVIAVVIALLVFLFGDNIYERVRSWWEPNIPTQTPEITPTRNPTLESMVQQTLQALTASASTPTITETLIPSATPPIETLTPSLSPTNSPFFSITDVDFAVSGQCGNFTIVAFITANSAGSVEYYWIRSDGAIDGAVHPPIVFTSAGTQQVSITWSTIAPGAKWIDIYVDSPNRQRFGRANFSCP